MQSLEQTLFMGLLRFCLPTVNVIGPPCRATALSSDPRVVIRWNLKAAVGCARRCRARGVRQGATTPRAPARKEEQRRMARRARCGWVRSALTQEVKDIAAARPRIDAVCPKLTSGQLPFLGSKIVAAGACPACVRATKGHESSGGAVRAPAARPVRRCRAPPAPTAPAWWRRREGFPA